MTAATTWSFSALGSTDPLNKILLARATSKSVRPGAAQWLLRRHDPLEFRDIWDLVCLKMGDANDETAATSFGYSGFKQTY